MVTEAGARWASALSTGGYESHCRNEADLKAIRRFGFVWRRIFGATGLPRKLKAFEIGCGGGEKMAPLALNGASVSGIDVSSDVLDRARQFFKEIETVDGHPLDVQLVNDDFFSYEAVASFDFVYHFGVVEHYLDPADRAEFWMKSVAMTKPGGWVGSIVPGGRHVMRPMVRDLELCGYMKHIAEVDYSAAMHVEEFRQAGLVDIVALPHAYFFFLSSHPNAMMRALYRPLFLLGNSVLPFLPLPTGFLERFAHTLIVLGRKPGTA